MSNDFEFHLRVATDSLKMALHGAIDEERWGYIDDMILATKALARVAEDFPRDEPEPEVPTNPAPGGDAESDTRSLDERYREKFDSSRICDADPCELCEGSISSYEAI